jgi:lysophospholipase L1-like esterase
MRTRRSSRRLIAILVLVIAGYVPADAVRGEQASAQPSALDLAKWEKDIAAFEAEDRAHPVAPGGILFAGSSSIRMWTTLARDFPGLPVLNRGFGGSQIREVTAFAPRIVLPYKPRLIIFYCGTNDIASGRTAAQAADDFRTFVDTVRTSLPETRIAFISAAPNESRWHLRAQMIELNDRVRAYAKDASRVDFIDVWSAMLGPDGRPKAGIYLDDQLHMNARGYEIWTRIVGAYLQAHPLARRAPTSDVVPGVRGRSPAGAAAFSEPLNRRVGPSALPGVPPLRQV